MDEGTAPVARGEHTPTPWTSKGPYYPNGTDYPVQYIDGGSDAVAMVCLHHARGEANAALIVEAVNNHTDLLAQRDELREALTEISELRGGGSWAEEALECAKSIADAALSEVMP